MLERPGPTGEPRLLVVHHQGLRLPPAWARRVAVVAERADWPTTGPQDVVIWGTAPDGLRLEGLPTAGRLLTPSLHLARTARGLGWPEVVLLPDLEPAHVTAALERDAVLPLESATLAPARGELWVQGRVVRLPGRERALLATLAAAEAPVPRERLMAGGSPQALEATLARLRRRTEDPLVVADRGVGWRLRRVPRPAPIAPPATELGAGDVTLDPVGRTARVGHATVPLGRRETELLGLLLAAGGQLVSRAVAGGALGIPDAGLDTVASRLRRRIGPGRLRTVRGRGWVLADSAGPATPTPEPLPSPLGLGTIEALAERHPLLTVVGGAGGELLAALARKRRWATFDVRGLAVERVLRWVERRHDPIVLHGFDDPSPWADVLAALVGEGRRLVIGAEAPLGHASERVVTAGSPREASEAAAAALDEPTARAVAELCAFRGPFDLDDVKALAPGFDPATAARRGLLVDHGGSWEIPSATRSALTGRNPSLDRWASWVFRTVERDLHARVCPKDRIVARVVDLAIAAEHLVASGSPEGAGAMVVWGRVGRWAGRSPTLEQITTALAVAADDEARASLLLVGATSQVDQASTLDLATRAERLGQTVTTRWIARFLVALHLDDRAWSPSRERCAALLAVADAPEDPAPPDLRAMLTLVVERTRAEPEALRRSLCASLMRLEERRWSPDEATAAVWLDDARAATLSELASVLLRLGDPGRAEAALVEGLAVASPDAVGILKLTRAHLLAHTGRWPLADRALDELYWSRDAGERLATVRVLGWRALLAAMHGPRALASTLADQLSSSVQVYGGAFGERQLHQVRAWLALDAHDRVAVEHHASQGYRAPMAAALVAAAGLADDPTGDRGGLLTALAELRASDNHGILLAFRSRLPAVFAD